MSLDQIKRDKKGRFTKDSYYAYWQGKKFSDEMKKKLSERSYSKKQRGIPKILTEKQRQENLQILAKAREKIPRPSKKTREKIVKSNIEHNIECSQLKKELIKQGFKAIALNEIKPDVIAFKDGKIYAYEVEFGFPRYEKYNDYPFFDDIIWVLKNRKIDYTVIRNQKQ